MAKKITPYECPKCHSDMDLECYDYEWDEEYLRQGYACGKCGAQWDEYFRLEWRGYACEGIDYDEKGEVQ